MKAGWERSSIRPNMTVKGDATPQAVIHRKMTVAFFLVRLVATLRQQIHQANVAINEVNIRCVHRKHITNFSQERVKDLLKIGRGCRQLKDVIERRKLLRMLCDGLLGLYAL